MCPAQAQGDSNFLGTKWFRVGVNSSQGREPEPSLELRGPRLAGLGKPVTFPCRQGPHGCVSDGCKQVTEEV